MLQNPTTKELREFLKKTVIERYGSVNIFVIQSSFEKADLSRFFAGSSKWNYEKLLRLLRELQITFKVK